MRQNRAKRPNLRCREWVLRSGKFWPLLRARVDWPLFPKPTAVVRQPSSSLCHPDLVPTQRNGVGSSGRHHPLRQTAMWPCSANTYMWRIQIHTLFAWSSFKIVVLHVRFHRNRSLAGHLVGDCLRPL